MTFLNHGSFGATPKPVFEVYQAWQRKVELEPVQFFMWEMYVHLAEARGVLGEFVGVSAENLAFVENATTGVNIVARSLPLQAGDEIIGTNHIYGACDKTLAYICRKTGAKQLIVDIPLPCSSDEITERIWSAVTPQTKLIFLSHITSPTALRLPVEEICRRAREAGIWTLIDGAHVPGQLDLDLTAMDCDFYSANCHKWLNSPKHAGFLYVRPDLQSLIEPLVISWGFDGDRSGTGSQFLERLQLQGTRSQAAYLSVPRAIEFLQEHDWDTVRVRCHDLVNQWLAGMAKITGLPSLYADEAQYGQFATALLPDVGDLPAFQKRLFDDHRVEMPCIEWNGNKMMRVSVQGYNDSADIEKSLTALAQMLA
ncbi:MAG TPA: aminotransferase class V-fold PLP-dependent enzyme [Anaerolineae bacterium]|nr:aminotransferase class V-fold PLP-dependent enzyme [Anaerolineae bacterium]